MSNSSNASRQTTRTRRRQDENPRQGSGSGTEGSRNVGNYTGLTVSRQSHRHAISERDSIFAENYVQDLDEDGGKASSAPPQSPAPDVPIALSHSPHAKMATTTTLTSTENTDILKRSLTPHNQQSYDLHLHDHNKGKTPVDDRNRFETTDQYIGSLSRPAYSDALADHILALPPFSSPTSSPKAPATLASQERLISAHPIRFGEDEERWKYRSWRQGLPVLGGRVMAAGNGEEPGASVDKKIEATLPRAEQAVVARSRKTSHLLGIFKQNEQPTEPRKDEKPQQETIPEDEEQFGDSMDAAPLFNCEFMLRFSICVEPCRLYHSLRNHDPSGIVTDSV